MIQIGTCWDETSIYRLVIKSAFRVTVAWIKEKNNKGYFKFK